MAWIRDLLSGILPPTEGDVWPPVAAPQAAVPRYLYYIGASFSHTGTNNRAEGPRTAGWLYMIWGYQGHIVTTDGEAGQYLADFDDAVDLTIARDVANDDMGDLMDAVVLEFFGDVWADVPIAGTTAINGAVALLTKMLTRGKKAYYCRFPPWENAAGSMLPIVLPDITSENWAAWCLAYETAMNAAGFHMIDAYYDWEPTFKVLNEPPGALDYHLTSESAYRAATRINAAIVAGLT